MGDIGVDLSERWYVLGVSGSGKTRFAKALARKLRELFPWAHLYVLDSKGDREFGGWPGYVESQYAPDALTVRPSGRGGIQVWSPPVDDSGEYGRWFGAILKARHPAIVLIDEVSSLGGTTATSFPVEFMRLLKQGRGLDIAAIVATQEAAYIPRQISKQATHFVYFGVSPDDTHAITQASRLLGIEPRQPAARFGLLYRRIQPRAGEVYEYSGYSDLLG